MKKFILVLAGMLLMTATVYAADYSPWAEESIEKAVEAGIVPDTLQSDYTNNITPQGILLPCGADLYG